MTPTEPLPAPTSVAGENPPLSRRSARVQRLLTDPPQKLLWLLGLPMMASFLFSALFSVVDRYFVSRLDNPTAALGGIGCAFAIEMILIAFGSGIGQGAASSVARHVGAKHYDKAALAGALTLGITIVLTIFVTLGAVFADDLMAIVAPAGHPEVLANATDYAEVMMLGSGAWFFAMILGGVLRGTGDMKGPMYAMMLATVLNLILDPMLIFGFGPIPAMGVKGAALASVIGRIAGSLLILWMLISPRNSLGRQVFAIKWNRAILDDILRVGAPASLSKVLSSVYVFIITFMLGIFAGPTGQAALLAGFVLDQLVFLPVIGLAIGLTTLVGQNHGAKLFAREREALRWCIFYAVGLLSVAGAVYFFAADMLAGLFAGGDAELWRETAGYLRISAIHLPLMGVMIAVGGAFAGRGRGMPRLLIPMLQMFVFGLPLFFFFGRYGLPTFWLALPISAALAAAISLVWIKRDMAKDGQPLAMPIVAAPDSPASMPAATASVMPLALPSDTADTGTARMKIARDGS